MVDKRPSAPHRGDVIVFVFPPDSTKDFVKRVIGLGARDTYCGLERHCLPERTAMTEQYGRFEVPPEDRSPRSPMDGPACAEVGAQKHDVFVPMLHHHRVVVARRRGRPLAWPSNEMFALIGESEPFTLLNNSLTCRLHGRVNSTGRVRRAFDNA